jgi:hypothetical protein
MSYTVNESLTLIGTDLAAAFMIYAPCFHFDGQLRRYRALLP